MTLLLSLPAAAADWFPPKDMMTIGVYYYPEAWPESQWPRDMANMKKLGMEYQYIEVPGGDHMTPLGRTPENMRKMFDFFDAHPKK